VQIFWRNCLYWMGWAIIKFSFSDRFWWCLICIDMSDLQMTWSNFTAFESSVRQWLIGIKSHRQRCPSLENRSQGKPHPSNKSHLHQLKMLNTTNIN
jgi:hypothetical protein